MIGAAGGGKVTVEGLSADVVLSGSTVTVKQGAKEITNVTGNIVAPSFLRGCRCICIEYS